MRSTRSHQTRGWTAKRSISAQASVGACIPSCMAHSILASRCHNHKRLTCRHPRPSPIVDAALNPFCLKTLFLFMPDCSVTLTQLLELIIAMPRPADADSGNQDGSRSDGHGMASASAGALLPHTPDGQLDEDPEGLQHSGASPGVDRSSEPLWHTIQCAITQPVTPAWRHVTTSAAPPAVIRF